MLKFVDSKNFRKIKLHVQVSKKKIRAIFSNFRGASKISNTEIENPVSPFKVVNKLWKLLRYSSSRKLRTSQSNLSLSLFINHFRN